LVRDDQQQEPHTYGSSKFGGKSEIALSSGDE